MLKYTYSLYGLIDFSFFCLWCFNATFGNISAISWRSVLVLEEAVVLERTTDHGQATGKLYHQYGVGSRPAL